MGACSKPRCSNPNSFGCVLLQAFEALILSPTDRQGKAITWDHAAGLENYMAKLDDVRRALVEKNRGLRAKQAYIAERMALLARCDLVKQRPRWFALVEGIRQVRNCWLFTAFYHLVYSFTVFLVHVCLPELTPAYLHPSSRDPIARPEQIYPCDKGLSVPVSWVYRDLVEDLATQRNVFFKNVAEFVVFFASPTHHALRIGLSVLSPCMTH